MDLTQEAIQELVAMGSDGRVVEVHRTAEMRYVLVDKGEALSGDGGPVIRNLEVMEFANDVPRRCHQVATLDSLVDLVKWRGPAKDGAVVFVDERQVVADLDYEGRIEDAVVLALKGSEEYVGLQKLCGGLDQKALWRLLVTDLYGCVPSNLAMAVGGIKLKAKGEETIEINALGLVDGSGRSGIEVSFRDGQTGEHTAQLPCEVTWKGRIWECWEREFEVVLRLEVTNEQGLRFTFHPRRLESVLQMARLELVGELRERLGDGAQVFEGRE